MAHFEFTQNYDDITTPKMDNMISSWSDFLVEDQQLFDEMPPCKESLRPFMCQTNNMNMSKEKGRESKY